MGQSTFYNKYKTYIQYIIIGILLILIPYLALAGVINNSTVTTIGTVLIYAISALGLSLLLGYSGLISLGTAGFMGLAAYFSAYFTRQLDLPFLLSFVLAVGIPVAISLLVGLASLRIEGYYLAIATLGIAEVFRKLFEQLEGFTGGYRGASARYPTIFGYEFDKQSTFILIVVVLVILMILMYNLVNSRTGRALLTMRGSNAAAQAMGINILVYRLVAFALATMFASVSGVLYVHFIKFAYPTDWILTLSLNILAIIVIGGMRSIGGAIIGSFIVYGFSDIVLQKLPVIGDVYGLASMFTGVLIILVILFYPLGLAHMPQSFRKWISNMKNREIKVEGEGTDE
jgi:branched-chain amino acid transport system permease protein